MKEKTDLRVIKTKRILYESLLMLLKDKPFEEIKVSDICDRALINRSTFYAHYADKYELFSSYVESLKKGLEMALEKNNSISSSKEYYLEMLSLFLDHILENEEIYKAIMQHNRNSIIMDMIYNAFKEDIEKNVGANDDKINKKVPGKFAAIFYSGAMLSVGMNCLSGNNNYTKDELLEYLDLLIPDNLNEAK